MSLQILDNLIHRLPQQDELDQQTLYDLFGGRCQESLLRQNLELQARVQELDSFAHMVAHDIKSPLASLIGMVTLLQDERLHLSAAEHRMLLGDVAGVARKLVSVVDELLLLAELGKAEAIMEPLHMAAIVADAQERLASIVQAYQAEIVLPAAWPAAKGYAPWIEEVWVNYLSNAIKYGGRPPRVELNAATQLDGSVCFWVRDNGPGIKLNDQARLFKPFVRLDRVRATGCGLGLTVVRHIVEKLGGQVGVCSAPGHGSVFSFTLCGCSSDFSWQEVAAEKGGRRGQAL